MQDFGHIVQEKLGAYYRLGNPSSPAILFLHGFLGNKEEWSDIADHLKADYQILAIDLPGHGVSLFEDPASYEMQICSANIITLLHNLNLRDRVYLVGYSMGGRLALYLAINYPQVFKKVLLISASPGIEDQQEKEKRIAADFILARKLENQDFGLFLEKWYDAELFSSLKMQPDLLRQIICKRMHNSPKYLAMSLDYMGTGQQKSLWQDLSCIQIPLDIVVGSNDAKFVSIGEKMRLCNQANIRLHKVKNAGHVVHLESKSFFYEFLKQWAI